MDNGLVQEPKYKSHPTPFSSPHYSSPSSSCSSSSSCSQQQQQKNPITPHKSPLKGTEPINSKNQEMGLRLGGNASEDEMSASHYRTHKAFLLCNYVVLGAASSCIFLTLSLRLLPSLCGLSLILLHVLTIVGAVSGCAAANSPSRSGRWYATHMVSAVLTAIFQVAVAVLVFTRTSDFLDGGLKSYVKEEDGAVILRMVGGLCVTMFCLQWVIIGLAFALRYYDYVAGGDTTATLGGAGGVGMMRRSNKVEDMKDWPWPFQV